MILIGVLRVSCTRDGEPSVDETDLGWRIRRWLPDPPQVACQTTSAYGRMTLFGGLPTTPILGAQTFRPRVGA